MVATCRFTNFTDLSFRNDSLAIQIFSNASIAQALALFLYNKCQTNESNSSRTRGSFRCLSIESQLYLSSALTAINLIKIRNYDKQTDKNWFIYISLLDLAIRDSASERSLMGLPKSRISDNATSVCGQSFAASCSTSPPTLKNTHDASM